MTDDKKPREFWVFSKQSELHSIEQGGFDNEDIYVIEHSAYDALAKENASLRASLKFAVETIEKALTYKNGICTTPTQNLEDNLATIKAKGEL
jgi:hypothetical protein